MLTVHATKKLSQRIGGFTKDPPPSNSAPLTSWYSTAIFWRPAGNALEVIEVSLSDAGSKLRGGTEFWRNVRRDGLAIHGLSIDRIAEL